MVSLLVQALLAYAVSAISWKLLREYFVKSPLDDLPGPPASSLLIGSMGDVYDLYAWKYHYEILQKYGSVMAFKGLLGERVLFLFDPKALHHILSNPAYESSPPVISTNRLFFGEGILATQGEQHRKQRKMLNPVFSTSHMREMTPIFYEVTERLRAALVDQVKSGPKEIDILHWITRTALELIGQSGMGYSFDALDGEDRGDYSRAAKRFGGLMAGPKAVFAAFWVFPVQARFNFPRVKRWMVDRFPSEWVQGLKEVRDVMQKTALDIYRNKQKVIESEGDDGKKDIISILMRANASAAEEDRLSEEEVCGQVSSLTFAAMDTTSSALSRIIHLLVEHPDVQNKLRAELIEAKKANGGRELDHDKLVSLPYLDAVCRETLRMYPPFTTINRTVRKDMIVPLSKPVKTVSGSEVTAIIVPTGTNIFISVLGANTNQEMWGKDSYEWKPERWLSPLPDNVSEAHMPGIYSNLMTFLGGSRACIGFKFSQLEMKVVLSLLITTFNFESSGKNIMWKMPGVAAPVVEGQDITHPSMPVVISLVEKNKQ